MLTVENMGPVLEAFRQDLRDMEAGVYQAPRPHNLMMWEDEEAYKRAHPYLGNNNNRVGKNRYSSKARSA